MALAHISALHQNILKKFEILNIGGGKSTTVLELVKTFEDTSGVKITTQYLPRRDGDLATFWADSSKANKKMNWYSKRNLKKICEDTWQWHKSNPNGYNK